MPAGWQARRVFVSEMNGRIFAGSAKPKPYLLSFLGGADFVDTYNMSYFSEPVFLPTQKKQEADLQPPVVLMYSIATSTRNEMS